MIPEGNCSVVASILRSVSILRTSLPALLLAAVFGCADNGSDSYDYSKIRASWVQLGENGAAVARVLTSDLACPRVVVDGMRSEPMELRVKAETLPQRLTRSAPEDSKPSAFPVTTCEWLIPAETRSLTLGGKALPMPKVEPRLIVVIGDTGCRLKRSDNAFQACNDPAQWTFQQIGDNAAASKPDLVIHLGDIHYRENVCPPGNSGCQNSPWGYGYDAYAADLFAPAASLLQAAPWIFVRGNHESCDRAGQGWWRFFDARPYRAGWDCNDPRDDINGDYSEPFAVPLGPDMQLLVFDSSKAGTQALATNDPVYAIYKAQVKKTFDLARNAGFNFFVDHHPVLGIAPDGSQTPTGFFPGNDGLRSVMNEIVPERLFPTNVHALLSGHVHAFQMSSFATPHPVQFISGNSGTQVEIPNFDRLPAGATPSPGAVIENFLSTNRFGYMTMDRSSSGWTIKVLSRDGLLLATCELTGSKATCTPDQLSNAG